MHGALVRSHLSDALVQVHIALQRRDLLDGELQDPALALLSRDLLLGDIQGPLRLHSGLLDLY